jgi:polyisoprenoid-binding protein YceI
MKLLIGTFVSAALAAGFLSAVPAAPREPATAPETYAVDPVHSSLVFHTRHLGIAEFYGRFGKIEGKSQLVLDGDKSSVLVVVDATSIDTGNKDRDEHLRSPDFFGAKEFPEIVFQSTKVEGSGDSWRVTGDLTLHGVTKSVTAEARKVGAGESRGEQLAGFLAELSIDMNDFGIPYVKQDPGALGPEVHLTISLECARK